MNMERTVDGLAPEAFLKVPRTNDHVALFADEECIDKNSYCGDWADKGYCKTNPKWMVTNCKKSCGVCKRQEVDASTRTTDGNWKPMEGPMLSVMPGTGKAKLILGMDVDYPPYAYLKQAPYDRRTDLDDVIGVGADMIKGMAAHCDFDVSIMQVHWNDCWGAGEIGAGLREGWYHGCMTYTHATGARNRYLEFTNSWAKPNKPAGLIVKLDNGKPAFNGHDDLDGKTIVDVTGWAPTADTLFFVKNQCTGKPFKNFKVIQGDTISPNDPKQAKGPNDKALLAVLEGKADAMWIYGDQAANYQCSNGTDEDGWNCDLWKGFGKTFAYVQSGLYGWMHNGTTIAMTKKGSGVAAFLDNCFESFRKTKEYYNVCKIKHHDHNQLSTCIPNKYFKGDPDFHPWTVKDNPYMFKTNKHKTGCSTGYCTCSGEEENKVSIAEDADSEPDADSITRNSTQNESVNMGIQ